jgi:hypothetical protein
MSQGALPPEEMEKLFHFRENYDGSVVPLYPVYDPDYRGEQYRDWGDESDWYIWVTSPNGLQRVRGFPERSLYFGKQVESSHDIYIPFFSFYTQSALFPDVQTLVSRLLVDVRHLSTSMSKIGLFDYLSRNGNLNPDQFVKSEVEYIFTTCRSMYETLYFVIKNTWGHIEILEGGKQELPKKFGDVALDSDGNPEDLTYLKEELELPDKLAEYFVDAAEDFANIRDARDKIIHHGKSLRTIFLAEDGLAVKIDEELFEGFDVWSDEQINENNLAPIWPIIAYVQRATFDALNNYVASLTDSITFPDPIAPDYTVFLRGDTIRYLPYLGYLIEVDPWGVYILEDVKQRYIDQ